jgi:hypothetical protein
MTSPSPQPSRVRALQAETTAAESEHRGTDVREYEYRYNHCDELGKDKGM